MLHPPNILIRKLCHNLLDTITGTSQDVPVIVSTLA
jgi:hypothetical protein